MKKQGLSFIFLSSRLSVRICSYVHLCSSLRACVLAAIFLLGRAEPLPAAESPYLRPEFERMMDAVTLHVSFDRDRLVPDLAEGDEYRPTIAPSASQGTPGPQFADGLLGRALVLGSGSAAYPRAGNVTLEQRGAVAIWIQPQNWQRPRDGNCVFLMTGNSSFYLERQGPEIDDEGRVRRQEGILYLAIMPGPHSSTIDGGGDWKNGQWHLLVANWSWPTMELSVNGGPFAVRSLSQSPPDGVFGDLVLGDRGGAARGLIDEVLAFRRPLALEEVQRLWQLRPAQN
jgi:hypothetical protein